MIFTVSPPRISCLHLPVWVHPSTSPVTSSLRQLECPNMASSYYATPLVNIAWNIVRNNATFKALNRNDYLNGIIQIAAPLMKMTVFNSSIRLFKKLIGTVPEKKNGEIHGQYYCRAMTLQHGLNHQHYNSLS